MATVGSTRNSSKTMSDLHSAATRCGSKIVITYSDVIAGYNRGAVGAGCHIVVFELPSAPGVRETEYVKAAHILAKETFPELRQNSGNGQSAGTLHRPVSLKAHDHPIDQHHDGAGQQYGARHGHGGADRSLVRLAYDHMEKETSRLSQDADKERRARRVLNHK